MFFARLIVSASAIAITTSAGMCVLAMMSQANGVTKIALTIHAFQKLGRAATSLRHGRSAGVVAPALALELRNDGCDLRERVVDVVE